MTDAFYKSMQDSPEGENLTKSDIIWIMRKDGDTKVKMAASIKHQ